MKTYKQHLRVTIENKKWSLNVWFDFFILTLIGNKIFTRARG